MTILMFDRQHIGQYFQELLCIHTKRWKLEEEYEKLEKAGINAVIVGKTTDNNDRVLWCEDERRFLELPQTDELHKVMEE